MLQVEVRYKTKKKNWRRNAKEMIKRSKEENRQNKFREDNKKKW